MSAVLVFFALFCSFFSYSSAQYCLCKPGGDTSPNGPYQKVIDYACGQGGANCGPIQSGGPCYQPTDIISHCNYAANAYYQNKKSQGATCDFGGVAAPSSSPPSSVASGCSYPTSAGSVPAGAGAGTGTGTGMGTPTGTPGGTTIGGGGVNTVPGSTNNGIFSPTGLGPTGTITDPGSGAFSLQTTGYIVSLSVSLFLGLLVLWD